MLYEITHLARYMNLLLWAYFDQLHNAVHASIDNSLPAESVVGIKIPRPQMVS